MKKENKKSVEGYDSKSVSTVLPNQLAEVLCRIVSHLKYDETDYLEKLKLWINTSLVLVSFDKRVVEVGSSLTGIDFNPFFLKTLERIENELKQHRKH